MSKSGFSFLILFLIACLHYSATGQTLIINEVSNGPGGAKEYVELVVVSDTITYDCSATTPPCIDIRGWIFDDNSGYHGGSGVAAGAVRFSFDNLWSCVPVGTIIVIYNDVDKNPDIPAGDSSLTDGNCQLVVRIGSTTLFEKNATTPGAAACSYPATGWTAGGNWTNTALANSSDCARLVNLAGCEVFSLCYGAADNLNNLIYFNSGADGTDNVWYFNGTDPFNQANWSEGCAGDIAACGANNQTPGVANNAANAAYIAQFNNGCSPITPIEVTATAVNAGCSCSGSATASASGSIAGYTYEWYDSSFTAIGQTAVTATGLCAGTYHVIGTSSIGCPDTATVVITGTPVPTVTVNSQTICAGGTTSLTATPSITGGTYSWSPGGQTTPTISVSPGSTTNYTVTYTHSGCTATGIGSVTVTPLPSVTVNSATICNGQSAILTGSGATSYSWYTGSTSNPITVSPTTTTNYTVKGTTADCADTAISIVTVTPLPTVTVNSPAICNGQSATLTAGGAATYSWNTGATINPLTVSPATTTNYTVTGTASGCSETVISTVTVAPLPSVTVNSPTICEGQTATLTASGATTYNWSDGSTSNPLSVSPTSTANYTVTGTASGCSDTAISTVTVNALPVLMVNSPSICPGQTATVTASGASTYSWNTGATSASITDNPASTTTYSVTGTTSGCSSTVTTSITVGSSILISVNSPNICTGQSVTLTADNASVYTWSNGDTGSSTTVSPANTTSYTVVGTNGSCSGSAISTVTVNSVPSVSVNSVTICNGQTATLTPDGATTYSWNNGSSFNPLSVSPASTTYYTVTGTTSGCSDTAIAIVTVNTAPTVNVNSPTICEGQNAVLNANGADTYSWNTGSASSSLTIAPAATTSYTVTGTTAGCTDIVISTVTVNSLPVVAVNSVTICEGQSATLTANGATDYSWDSGSTSNPLTVSPTSTTSYTVEGTTTGCSNSAIATVTVNPLPVLTVNSPSVCSGQSAIITASGATTYSWSNGAATASITESPATTTTYSVTGTSMGCSSTVATTITVGSSILMNVNSPAICSGQPAILVADNASSYTWSTGDTGNTITVIPVGSSSYTVTGTNGTCSGTAIAIVTVNSIPDVTVNAITICEGQPATLTANGATLYEWNTGDSSGQITVSPMSTTNYTATGSTSGCSDTAIAVVTVNPLPAVTVDSQTVCLGQPATLTANGAASYSWDTGDVTNSITVSPTSTTSYIVTGTTAGCSSSASGFITVLGLPFLTITSDTICEGEFATLTVSGATSYSWNTGDTSPQINVAPIGTTTYNVVGATDGCTSLITTRVVVNPVPVIMVDSATICDGQTAVLTATGGTVYSWSTGDFSNTIEVSPDTATSYTVTGTTNGCSSIGIGSVSVNPSPVLTVDSASICEGQSATITAIGGISYSWSTGDITNSITVSPASTTFYTVSSSLNGCTDSAVVSVTVNSLPLIDVSPQFICEGESATITANGAQNYEWSNGANGDSITVSPATTTIYTVTGVDVNGCSNSGTVAITVNPVPVVSVNSVTLCSQQSAILTANGATSYSWNTGDITPDISVTPTVTTNYTVTGTSGSCSSLAFGTVTVRPLPPIVANSLSICEGRSATLTASGASGYSWDIGSTSATISVTPASTTSYTVTGTASGCSDTAIATVTVNPYPVLSATGQTICSGDTAVLTANGATSYVWNNGATSSQIEVKPTVNTIYTVTGITSGCSGSTTVLVAVNPSPTVAFKADKKSGCAPVCVNFSDQSTILNDVISSWSWSFEDGGASAEQNPQYCFNAPGLYDVNLTVTSTNGCSSTLIKKDMISVYDFPVAEFETDKEESDLLAPGFLFTNLSTNAVKYYWDFGDSVYSAQTNPIHSYNLEGTYSITLVATSNHGCKDTVEHEINIKGIYTFYAPNAFSPEGDGGNDVFNPMGTGWDVDTYRLYIFDRWGNTIYTTDEVDKGWDGRYSAENVVAPIDVYVWKVELMDLFSKKHSYVGTVTVVK